jgi:hypothetical protein
MAEPKISKERHVNIFTSEGKSVVWPPYLLVKEGETVVFRAVDTAVTITLPSPAIFEDPTGKVETQTDQGATFEIAEGKRKRLKAIKRNTKFKNWLKTKKLTKQYPVRGVYSYSVYCHKTGQYAEGNSSPKLIGEPPDPPPPRPG